MVRALPRLASLGLVLAGRLALAAEPAPAWPASAQQAALGLVDALRAGDEAGALARAITFEEWSALSLRRLDRAQHEAALRGWLGGLARELRAGLAVDDPVLADVLLLPRDEKLRRPVVMAVFHLRLHPPQDKGARPPTLALAFVEVDGRWRFMLRD
ncbi:MAG TPA: hypothetical protein PK668_04120 [Myxococcota bacterium]|nr:hypothetical protein [Myxococcota bacterium]HRY92045.1 hypothetical protein [Myxococcota bacterium]HSA24302.1 hypothetical protein [Myxococcota bacterium]